MLDASGNPVNGAAVTIEDQNENQVYSGTSDSNGKIANMPLVTTTLSVAAGGDNGNPTTITKNNLSKHNRGCSFGDSNDQSPWRSERDGHGSLG